MVHAVSDHNGVVTVLVHVNPNTPTQLGVIRIQEATTGVYSDSVFVIAGNANATTLTALPTQFTFTGPNKDTCGTGTGTFEVFDGTPPYTAISSIGSLVTVSPTASNTQPGVFNVNANNPSICGDADVIVTDSVGAHADVKVTTVVGSAAAPVVPTAILISPATITLSCGQSGSASVAGGAGTYSAASPIPNVTVTLTGNTITATRVSPDPPPGTDAPSATTNITVTDGATFTTWKVTSPTDCP
jgi:hypothetical protein